MLRWTSKSVGWEGRLCKSKAREQIRVMINQGESWRRDAFIRSRPRQFFETIGASGLDRPSTDSTGS